MNAFSRVIPSGKKVSRTCHTDLSGSKYNEGTLGEFARIDKFPNSLISGFCGSRLYCFATTGIGDRGEVIELLLTELVLLILLGLALLSDPKNFLPGVPGDATNIDESNLITTSEGSHILANVVGNLSTIMVFKSSMI